jgi:tRNA-binding protein
MATPEEELTQHYSPEALVGRQVIAAVTRRIAGFVSQVLVLGAMPTAHEVVLLEVDRPVPNGARRLVCLPPGIR